MKYLTLFLSLVTVLLFYSCNDSTTDKKTSAKKKTTKLKALIIDGENNHGVWPKTTMMIKDYLEQTTLFKVDIERTAFTWQGPHFRIRRH